MSSTMTPPEAPELLAEAVVHAPEEPPSPGFLETMRGVDLADWVTLGLAIALFAPLFSHLYREWSDPHAPQSYGLLVLPASALLAWMLRERVRNLAPQPNAKYLAVAAFGLLFLAAGTLIAQYTIGTFGFVVATTGVVLARYGVPIARRMAFPLAFLLAMIPLPHELMNMMTFHLQQISVKGAGLILKLFGDVQIQGTRIVMSHYTLDVIAPCSGMTIILPLLALVLYYLYLVVAPAWKKGVLFLLTFPVALIINSVRVALIGVVGESFGSKAATTFHDYSGLITVVLGFGLLIFLAQEMRCHRISEEISL